MVDRLLSDPTLLAPIAALRHLKLERATDCGPKAMVKVFAKLFAIMEDNWPTEVAHYEAFIHQLRRDKPEPCKPANAVFTIDPAEIIASITSDSNRWRLPTLPQLETIAYVGWFDKNEPQLRKVEGQLAVLLHRIGI